MSQEEGLTYYQELFTKMTAGLSDRKKAEVTQLCDITGLIMYSVREPSICGKDAFYACRKRLKKDRRYPFCAGGGSALSAV